MDNTVCMSCPKYSLSGRICHLCFVYFLFYFYLCFVSCNFVFLFIYNCFVKISIQCIMIESKTMLGIHCCKKRKQCKVSYNIVSRALLKLSSTISLASKASRTSKSSPNKKRSLSSTILFRILAAVMHGVCHMIACLDLKS